MAHNRTIQLYRGTTAQNDAFTGAIGELTMDTTTNELRLHDGTTAGGHKIGGNGYHPGLFAHEWDDHLRNDVQWLRADTFSWHNGSEYEEAYNHLVDDINNSTLYGWSASASSSSTDPTVACAFSTNATLAPGDQLYFFPADSNRTSYNDITQATIKTIYASDVGLETGNFFLSGSRLYYKSLSSIEYVRRSVVDITLVSETISGITVQYYLAADGHKICPASEESNVAAIYAATGVAWYYILDPENQRFKLPRTQYNEVGVRDTVGKYVPESLPNITAIISGTVNSGSSSGAAQDGSSYAGNWNYGTGSLKYVDIDASGSSSAYQNDAPVQQRATQMYLYFYVGSFTQTAIENTAGLNAELFNGKADTDLSNTPMATADYVVEWQAPAAGNNYTWYRKYKSGWVEQGGQFAQSGDGVSITLPITMANANYSVVGGTLDNSGAAGWRYANRTTTGFTKNLVGSTQCGGSWEVRGMAAS